MLKLFLYLLIVFHAIVVIANLTILFVIPFLAPVYISIPIDTLIVNLMFSPTPCPLTRLESSLRVKLGMPQIKHFVGHYFLSPIRKVYRKLKR